VLIKVVISPIVVIFIKPQNNFLDSSYNPFFERGGKFEIRPMPLILPKLQPGLCYNCLSVSIIASNVSAIPSCSMFLILPIE
jgi:hypothetical protein